MGAPWVGLEHEGGLGGHVLGPKGHVKAATLGAVSVALGAARGQQAERVIHLLQETGERETWT